MYKRWEGAHHSSIDWPQRTSEKRRDSMNKPTTDVKHFSQEVKLADVEAFVSTTLKNIP
jgi:hypothetical protein